MDLTKEVSIEIGPFDFDCDVVFSFENLQLTQMEWTHDGMNVEVYDRANGKLLYQNTSPKSDKYCSNLIDTKLLDEWANEWLLEWIEAETDPASYYNG